MPEEVFWWRPLRVSWALVEAKVEDRRIREERETLRAARVAAAAANSLFMKRSKKPWQPEDFFPELGDSARNHSTDTEEEDARRIAEHLRSHGHDVPELEPADSGEEE